MSAMNGKDVDIFLREFSLYERCTSTLPFEIDFLSSGVFSTVRRRIIIGGKTVTQYVNEFWSPKQRQGSSIHEVSYRACFKPQLISFFVDMLTEPGQVVYDPFGGRGTTAVESALMGRNVVSNDANPLSVYLLRPRLNIPSVEDVEERLKHVASIPLDNRPKGKMDLSMFFHNKTEREIWKLRDYLEGRRIARVDDNVDDWIRLVATNRLTGHSNGFFSVYSLPPNQAVTPERQIKINEKYGNKPTYRDTVELITKKTNALLSGVTEDERERLIEAGKKALLVTSDARSTPDIEDESIDLVVTSPPFLDVVDYTGDNWMRCWFNRIDTNDIKIDDDLSIDNWNDFIGEVFDELYRVVRCGGWVAFEVGEVQKGKIKLDEYVVPLGIEAGFECVGIVVNKQGFTKTSRIWLDVNEGTNTNRIVLFRKGVLG